MTQPVTSLAYYNYWVSVECRRLKEVKKRKELEVENHKVFGEVCTVEIELDDLKVFFNSKHFSVYDNLQAIS